MAQRTDLYSILVSYANKNNSPYIEIGSFLDYLGRYARQNSEKQPEWNKWVQDRTVKFWSEVSALAEEGKCELLSDTVDGRIYMPHFYLELLNRAYQNAEEESDLPFPGEESLRITLPENQTRPLNAGYDIPTYLEHPQDTNLPIIKIIFGDGFGSALVLSGMIPRRLTEIAILKIRNYLRKYGNTEYALRKLNAQIQSNDSSLRDLINRILLRPLECYGAIESGGEFSYLFWAHFSILIKEDIKKKKERLPEDVGAFQSVLIIEAISAYYRSLAIKRREMELAFKSLEQRLAKPPYLYTLNEILRFTSDKGVLLLKMYTKEALEEWLKKKITESKNNELPDLLVVKGPGDERCFLQKDKTLALCFRLLADARVRVKDAVSNQWRRLLTQYQSEPAMNNDAEFEKLLAKLTRRMCPVLANLFDDPKLLLINDEIERKQSGTSAAGKLFSNGQLLSYATLYFVARKEMLLDIKLGLPFWYSMPIVTALIAFFKNLSGEKKAPEQPSAAGQGGGEDVQKGKDAAGEIRAAAKALEYDLVPQGRSLDGYLEELENRWTRLLDKEGKNNLVADVKSLIRDHLRRSMKVRKQFHITQEAISQLAADIVGSSPALASLSGRSSLILYTKLYILKQLESIKKYEIV